MENTDKNPANQPLILFDGTCILCNATVNFVAKRDVRKVFYFAHLQSRTGNNEENEPGTEINKPDSIILIEQGRRYYKSSAILRIFRKLKQPYPLFYALKIIPGYFRNRIYDFIAKRRYLWFGKQDSCIPHDSRYRDRFTYG